MRCKQDVVYRYDGSWAGFLCCVFESVYQHELPFDILPFDEASLTLFHEKPIDTDEQKAHRVQASFAKKMGNMAPEVISTAFLSGQPSKEIAILRFLLLGYKLGAPVLGMHGHPDVAPVLQMERNATGEAHHLTGFVHFQDYGDFLGATIDPKNYILPLLRQHFCDRFPEERFVIFDRTHTAVLLYEPYSAQYVQLSEAPVFPEISEGEAHFTAMWKQFCKSVAIKQRINPKLQQSMCPKRHWRNMPEMVDLLAKQPADFACATCPRKLRCDHSCDD